jgi:hypothetical protein
MFGVTQDQFTHVLRWAMTGFSGMVAGWMVSRGYVSVTTAGTLTAAVIGAAPGLAALIWGLVVHSDKGTIGAAAALPSVTSVVTTPAIANGPTFAENTKVVSESIRVDR